jgi:hypothetical protein
LTIHQIQVDVPRLFAARRLRELSTTMQTQLGLDVTAIGAESLSGLIWDDTDPRFANHSYQYKIQHGHVAVKRKILMDSGYWLMP